MKHPDRKAAEIKYKNALLIAKKAETKSSQAFDLANELLNIARAELVKMEIKYPTYNEYKKETSFLKRANRGLDIHC